MFATEGFFSYLRVVGILLVAWVMHILFSALLKHIDKHAYDAINFKLVENANDVFFALFILLGILLARNVWQPIGYLVAIALVIRAVNAVINVTASIPTVFLVIFGNREERPMLTIALSNILNALVTIVLIVFAYENILVMLWPFA